LDIITHINSTFSVLTQLGVGPSIGFMIEDDQASWEDFIGAGDVPMNMVKTYVHLKVRVLFDPPSTSFHLDALNKQLQEYEWRLNLYKDVEPV
jgi:hypothetical protein